MGRIPIPKVRCFFKIHCTVAGSGGSLATQSSIKIPSAGSYLSKVPMHYASMGGGMQAKTDGIPQSQTWASNTASSSLASDSSPFRGMTSAVTWGPSSSERPMSAATRKPEGLASVKLA